MSAGATRTIWSDMMAMANDHMQGVEWSFSGAISLLRRRWTVIAGSIAVCLAIAILLLLLITPKYSATALVQINTRPEQVTTYSDVVGELTASDATVRTEMDVMTSRKLANRVIEKLHMMDANGGLKGGGGVLGQLKNALIGLVTPIHVDNPGAPENGEETSRDAARTRAIDTLLRNLDVAVKPRSYTIQVTYTDSDPERAQLVANTLATEYLNSQLEDRYDATKRANEWMNGRLKQLQRDVQNADLAVQKFRETNGLSEAKGVRLSEQQISELSSQLILSRAQLAEAQAKAQRAKQLQASGRGIESAAEVLNSPLIMNLRSQEAELRRNMTDLSTKYGPNHPRMQTARNEVRDLQGKIYEEITKIQGSLDNDVAVAQARVATLQGQLDDLQNKSNLSTDANVQLSELERQAEAQTTFYNSFLARSKEVAQMDFAQTDARVISAAEAPLDPSSPKKGLILALAVIMGAGIGVALVLALEALDSGYRTTQQLEAAINVPVHGLLGELSEEQDPAHYVVNRPTGAFTEAVRAIRTALQFSNPEHEPKVVMVSSSVPQEGKSLFALSLAQLTASGGGKALLIDADMRRPSIAKQLGLKVTSGLSDLLEGDAKVKNVLQVLPKSGLHVIPAVANTKFSQELLGGQKMKDLMAAWRKEYDLIVIDCPPVMAVADAITVSGMVDAVMFMVRWGSTPRQLVANAIKQLQSCNAPLAGCVITRVDLEKQSSYGYGDYGYFHGKYKEYYSD